jgi:hypothetical protein
MSMRNETGKENWERRTVTSDMLVLGQFNSRSIDALEDEFIQEMVDDDGKPRGCGDRGQGEGGLGGVTRAFYTHSQEPPVTIPYVTQIPRFPTST